MLRSARDGLLVALSLGWMSGALAAQGVPPGTLPPVPVPMANPITPEKALLGKALFWDEQLSSTNSVACGSCHIPSAGGADPRSLLADDSLHPGADGLFDTPDDVVGTRGVIRSFASGAYESAEPFPMREQVTDRQAPSMINAAFSPTLFWDGRATASFVDPVAGEVVLLAGAALESQAVGPPVSDVEMGHVGRDWDQIVAKLSAVQPLALASDLPDALADFVSGRDYPSLFAEAFPGNAEVSATNIAMAIATYERTLLSVGTPFDNFLQGIPGSLTPLQNQGRQVFVGQGRCVACHGGPLMSDNQFHALGVRPPNEDLGRGAITGLPVDNGRFRTPGLRNVQLRAPYFHNGSMPTLADVVDFYDRGGDFPQNQDPLINPLGLTQQQKDALVAFLETALDDPRVPAELPPFDRPTLSSESGRRPELFASGGVGSGGFVPRAVAVEPPLIGSPAMTLGLADGLAGAPVLLGVDLQAGAPNIFLRHTPFLLGATPAMHFYPAGTLVGNGPGEGATSLTVAIPEDPELAGVEIVLQWFVIDPGAAGGVAGSDGTRLEFFAAN
ncbi:MAG: hypothetical protein DHS20C15_29180 [Planctomycetota bacterium]|nr:MAG: hypothetical protein DHS20C15_29180 [Planctomycetota bacterium]